MNMLMGITPRPKSKMYWNQKAALFCPAVADTMPRDRFDDILKYLHFADNATADPTDRLAKLRPLMEIIQANIRLVYVPEEEISIRGASSSVNSIPQRDPVSASKYISYAKVAVRATAMC
jgi:hypothetical protein